MTDPIARLSEALTGRYAVEHELGEGGMAVVYLAQDLRHHRKVALKVLKPELAAVVGAERFLAEIETTANLQHPHILPLFDSGEADGFLFYVMPYVEGESLRSKLDREHQLPVDEALRIATDLAEALDYAHRHGVIHRDIKPANVLMHEGRPLIADFGIALAVGAAGGTRLTETGLSVGTPYYMSPEQATGDMAVGPPSDIYALGCVLYEMLVGEPPYTGATAQAVLGRIIQGRTISATDQRASIPANVDAAIRKALEKLPADRFPVANDFGKALADSTFRHGETAAAAGPAARGWRRAAIGTSALSAALLLALAWALLRPAPAPPVSRYGLSFLPGEGPIDGLYPTMALAPDGSSIVYVGAGSPNGQLWIKRRDQLKATVLSGTDGAVAPSVSPDGEWVLYTAPGENGVQIRKIPIVGGASVVMADSVNPTGQTGAAWLDDGTIVYADVAWRLRRIPAGGGAADTMWTPPQGRFPIFPEPLPDARGVLFGLCDANCRSSDIWALDLRSGKAHEVAGGAGMAEYVSIGRLVYVRPDGSVFAAPFDLGSLKTTGPAVPVLQGVKVDGGIVPDFALSRSGTLLMRTGQGASDLDQFVWVTRAGVATPVDSSWSFDPGDSNMGWTLAPDGKRLAARIHTDAGDNIWVKELPHGPLSRLTFDSTEDRMPHWSSDGRSVTFLSDRPVDDTMRLRVWTKRADGVGDASLVYGYSRDLAQGFWSPDGKWLVLRTGGVPGVTGGRDILGFRPGEDTAATSLMAAGYDEEAPAVSSDSRWIAYVSNETGRDEVFVRPFPDVNGGKWQVSTDGGDAPLWAHSGRELFFVNAKNDVVSASVRTGAGFSVGTSKVLFHLGSEYVVPSWCCQWDVTPDDQRFLMVRGAGTGKTEDQRTILVENWFEELKSKLGSQ